MASRDEVEKEIRKILASQIPGQPDPMSIQDNVPIFSEGLGLDSMSGLSLMTEIEERFNVYIDDDDFDIFDSLHQIVDYVAERCMDPDK